MVRKGGRVPWRYTWFDKWQPPIALARTSAPQARGKPRIYSTQPPVLILRHPAYRLCSRTITKGLLIKPAVLSGVVGQGTRRNGGASLTGKPKSHPVKPFVDRADEGFVGMLFESKGGQRVIKVFHGFAQVPGVRAKIRKSSMYRT